MVVGSKKEPKISSRDQLVQALGCASELEHMLCLQYLFAAFSMRRSKEDFPPDTPEPVWRLTLGFSKPWIAQIYMIARQEMEHLGLATNLLSSIGAEPHFQRPNFPVPRDKTLVDVPMCLAIAFK
jgi:hypothetical protein